MNYRYPLPQRLQEDAAAFVEFANGAAQCRARLRDGSVHEGLLSNGAAIIAMRGRATLPFEVEAVDVLFQSGEDLAPTVRGGWEFFDAW